MEQNLLFISSLLLLSVGASKLSSRLGFPALLAFLVLGVSAAAFGANFHDVALTQTIAVLALCFILFSGGMDTDIKLIRPIFKSGILLASFGVVVATALVGYFAINVLHFAKIPALLLGATIASTDVAAVFTVLRSRQIGLQQNLRSLLEFESAVNDPTTVILSVGLLEIYMHPSSASLLSLFPLFVQQVAVGVLLGWLGGLAAVFYINRLRLEFDGLYPVLSTSIVLLIYALTQRLGGSGFLAVYVAGICLGNKNILRKKTLVLFHDGLAWLMQVAMFLAMGLLISFTELKAVALSGFLLSAFLIFVARPLSVHLCLIPLRFRYREVLFISWAGLRGAVPIILATYPLLAGIPEAKLIFNLVFFVVISSILLQGSSLAFVARLLKVDAPLQAKLRFPIEYNPSSNLKNELSELTVQPGSAIVDKTLLELELPQSSLVVLIRREEKVFVPRGSTRIEAKDVLLLMADQEALKQISSLSTCSSSAGTLE